MPAKTNLLLLAGEVLAGIEGFGISVDVTADRDHVTT